MTDDPRINATRCVSDESLPAPARPSLRRGARLQPGAEPGAARALALHAAGVRPRARHAQRRDAGHALARHGRRAGADGGARPAARAAAGAGRHAVRGRRRRRGAAPPARRHRPRRAGRAGACDARRRRGARLPLRPRHRRAVRRALAPRLRRCHLPFSPLLGALALASAVLLVALAWVNERATRAGVERGQDSSRARPAASSTACCAMPR